MPISSTLPSAWPQRCDAAVGQNAVPCLDQNDADIALRVDATATSRVPISFPGSGRRSARHVPDRVDDG